MEPRNESSQDRVLRLDLALNDQDNVYDKDYDNDYDNDYDKDYENGGRGGALSI